MIVYFNRTKVKIMYCTSSMPCVVYVKMLGKAVVEISKSGIVVDINGVLSIVL